MERERTTTIQQLIAAIQRRWGARALRILGDATEGAIPAVTTGFDDLDRALHIGGVPRGRITELLGTPTSGMTTIALTLIAQAQARGDLVAYVDLSRTFDAEYAAAVGVDLPSLLLVRPSSATDALELIHALVASRGIGVLIVDSLALLQSLPRDALLLHQALRLLPGPLAASPCALIVLTMLPYSSEMVRALAFRGSALAHAAAVRLHIAREGWLGAEEGGPGCSARITVLKHRLAPPDGQARVVIRFEDAWSL